jgi:uncharacterized membrane protein YhaH (DUF805 family)
LADKSFFWLFFSLKGRISPAVYFLAGLLLIVIQAFLLYRFTQAPLESAAQGAWALAFWVAAFTSIWSNIALTGKRLHDFGRPAAWALITLVIGFLGLLVLPFIKGDPGPNRYGASTNAPG